MDGTMWASSPTRNDGDVGPYMDRDSTIVGNDLRVVPLHKKGNGT